MLVLRVCFVLLRLETPCFSVPGFQVFHSPFVARDPSADAIFLPGSCLIIADTLSPEHSLVCEDIKRLRVSLNVTCCFLTCQHYIQGGSGLHL